MTTTNGRRYVESDFDPIYEQALDRLVEALIKDAVDAGFIEIVNGKFRLSEKGIGSTEEWCRRHNITVEQLRDMDWADIWKLLG